MSRLVAVRPLGITLALLALLARPAVGRAQVPLFHGELVMTGAHGSFDPETGQSSLNVSGWRLIASTHSNGVFPEREPLLIQVTQNSLNGFFLDAGMLTPSRKGATFSYRAPRDSASSIRHVRLKLRREGSYRIRFALRGIDLQNLINASGDCEPLAVFIGDDDFFTGVDLRRPGSLSRSRRLRIPPVPCDASWPWTQ